MIKNIKFFLNDNIKNIKSAMLVRDKIELNGFCTSSNKYDTVISVGDYQLFNKMLKTHNYSEYLNYCFLDEKELNEEKINSLIHNIKNNNYSINHLELMKMTIDINKYLLILLATNKIVVKNVDDDKIKAKLYIDGNTFEQSDESGILFTNSSNQLGGNNIIYSKSSIFQIIPLHHLKLLTNSLSIPNSKKIIVKFENKSIIIDVSDETYYYNNIPKIEIEKVQKNIKCIGLDKKLFAKTYVK